MKLIPLSQGKFARVDDRDFSRLSRFKWTAHREPRVGRVTWYAIRSYTRPNGKRVHVRMHKSVLGISGRIIVDHRDGDGLNNQQHNLRKASKAQNGQNSQKRVCPTSSKFKGVTWDKARGKWQAKICAGYNRVALGRFELEEDAARAYDAAAEKMHGEFAKVNFDNRLEKSNMIA